MREPLIRRKKDNFPVTKEINGKEVKVYLEEQEDNIFSLLNENEEDNIKEDDSFELLELLKELKRNIQDLYPCDIWVKGEISGWKKSGQHIYFDLIQRNKAGIEEAKINAKLWSTNINKVLLGFKNKTNEDLKNGMNCEWLISLSYHEKYGFSVVIQDVKPIWTVGEHEKKQILIREKLKKENLWDIQKNYDSPKIVTRLAIVAPEGAAGLGDFKSESDKWSKNGIMAIDYKTAIFEGDKARRSVSMAIHDFSIIQNNPDLPNYDLLIILRGGGSKASLAWLDEYEISKEICLFNGPVWTAIGHEQDFGILDEVANASIHTPSKAAQKIWDMISEEYHFINHFNENLEKIYNYKIESISNNINNMMTLLKKHSLSKVQNLDIKIDSIISNMKISSNNKLSNFERNSEYFIKNIIGLSPRETLKRGYAIATNEKTGKVIKSTNEINDQDIKIILHKGNIIVRNKDIIIKNEENNE